MSITLPILENSVVINIISFSDEASASELATANGWTLGSAGGKIGDTWDGLQYVTPAIVIPVPKEVSPYQARKALKDAGVLPAVLALMASLDETDDARMAWEYATAIYRQSPFITTLGAALGLTETKIDDLFRAAAQIT